MPLRLAFEAREGELGGGQDHNTSIVLVFLRLTFEAREGGEELLKHPLRLVFEARKGGWRGGEAEWWWVTGVGDRSTV